MKLNPLLTIQRMLKWLCICPMDENDASYKKILFIMWSVFSIICSSIGSTSSVRFFSKYLSTDLKASINAILPFTSTLNFLYMIINAYIVRHKIVAIFKRLSEIFEKCKYFLHHNQSISFKIN